MRITKIVLSLLMLVSGVACQKEKGKLTVAALHVEAPFAMPAIQVPDFSRCETLRITDYGATPGDQQKTSRAIAQAIEAAHQRGGGTVVVPAGEWPTGAIHLKSHVNLHLEKDAVLRFSDQPADYLPPVMTTWEGMECYNYSPLIYAFECQNVAITGEGELNAKMDVWERWFARPPAHMAELKRLYYLSAEDRPVEERQMVNDSAHFRPHFLQFNRCENVLLEGVTITNSPFWTIHPYLCTNVVIRNVRVFAHGHNNDGVDPEMSQQVLIEDCVFDQGDDAIAIKSGRNQDAWRLNTPTKNVIVRNCLVKNGHQLVALGSELSGGIENVLVDSCRVLDGAKLNHLLFIKTNERRGGYVKNIHVRNVTAGKIDQGILGIETDVLYQWRDLVPTLERRLTPISEVYLTNVKAADVQFISRMQGQAELPIDRIRLDHVTADTLRKEAHLHENVTNFHTQN
ncbi:glycoside hydrolase family 28 protein [Catalinimonas alkaloidigena]|uniref:glycoside hydrolase family 28 protein n=1 Tax=Catalinimonas alkaloidigena TaxID=1075417 RepID=UPI001FE21DAE|nr:glycoside hydrolase family 28 protein [Catalinimonas alkaloidigena]